METNNQVLKKTTDIWFMGFLQSKGYKLTDFEVINPGKSIFILMIAEDEWKKHKLAFHGHEVNVIRRYVEGLKDLSFL